MTRATKWLAGLTGLLGLWLIVAPFVFTVPTTPLWNAVIVGIVIAIIGGYNYYRTTQDQEVGTWGAGLNTLLGLWMIAAPFVFGVSGLPLWNAVSVGILVALFAGYNTYVGTRGGQKRRAQPT